MTTTPRIGSLCSGYRGLDAAVEAVFGGTTAWVSDIDPGASQILAHHWPSVPNLGDLTTVDWTQVEPVDIVCGGYPCQPFSDAGKRLGVNDERHIWPYIADALRVLRPRYVVLENVRGHLGRGFDTVLGDLAALGFDAQWCTARASEVGAPHKRERMFVLATAENADGAVGGQRRVAASGQAEGRGARSDFGGRGGASVADADGRGFGASEPDDGPREPNLARGGAASDADGGGRGDEPRLVGGERPAERVEGDSQARDWGQYAAAVERWERVVGRAAPWAVDDRGRLNPEFVEFMMGLPAGHVTAVPGLSRNAQLRALGNGVVPQQAEAALRLLLARVSSAAAAA